VPHETALIATIAAGLGLAFHSPGFVADMAPAQQLAEIGVILLMFGVGIHFSLDDLLAVRRIALPGAAVQIAAATVSGAAIASLWGWSWGTGLVFGLSLSVASTVVLLRAGGPWPARLLRPRVSPLTPSVLPRLYTCSGSIQEAP